MNYKFALIDLDGTLLQNRTTISKKNLDGIKEFKEKNGEVVIATGRWPLSAITFNKMVEEYTNSKNKYLIALNGALIYSRESEEPIFEKIIENNVFLEIIEEAKKFNICFWIYSKEGMANKIIHTHKMPFKKIVSFFNYGKLVNYNSEELGTYKLLFLSFNAKKVSKFYNLLMQKYGNLLEISPTNKRVIEVTSKNVNKGKALEFLLDQEKVLPHEIVVFGDSSNDVEMFKIAGLKISLNSKNDELCNISNVVLNHHNGVHDGIHNYVFQDISFNKNKVLLLDFSNVSFNIINENHFIKNLYFWRFLKTKQPFIIVSKYSLNDNLYMYRSLININDNALIFSGNGTTVFSCKTKKILKKSCLSATQMVLLQDFLLEQLENPDISIVINQISGLNLFLTKNYTNFFSFIKNSEFDENNFIIIDKNFSDYINEKSNRYTNINIIGLSTIPEHLNTKSLNIFVRGNAISICNKEIFINEMNKIVHEYFNSKKIEKIDVSKVISSNNKLFESVDNVIKENFL